MLPHHFNANLTAGHEYVAAAPFIEDAEAILKLQADYAAGVPGNFTNDDWQTFREGPLSMLGNAHPENILGFYLAVCDLVEGRGLDLASYEAIRIQVKADRQREAMEAIRI